MEHGLRRPGPHAKALQTAVSDTVVRDKSLNDLHVHLAVSASPERAPGGLLQQLDAKIEEINVTRKPLDWDRYLCAQLGSTVQIPTAW